MKSTRVFLLTALATSCGKLLEGPVNMSALDSDISQQARIALMVLRAVQEDSPGVGGGWYLIHPSDRRVDESEVVSFLADHPKPVECSSSVVDGHLSISCRHLRHDDSARLPQELREEMIRQLRETLRGMDGESQAVTGQSIVSMRGAGASLLFPFEDLDGFLRDFRIPFSCSIVPPDAKARARGAVAEFTVGPPGALWSP
jgi:hypothetical protein